MTLIKFATQIRPDQRESLELIATRAVTMQDHVQRALDMYFSQPQMEADLAEAKRRAGDNPSAL